MITREQLYERFLQIHLSFRPRGSGRIYLDSGYNISLVANEYTYCYPRSNYGPWTHVEVGFPSDNDPLITDIMDEGIGSYIPIEIIIQLIIKHGGLA